MNDAKVTVPDILQAKRDGRKLVMVTAYDYPFGLMADEAGVDMALVGDSLGMVVLGLDSTVPVTLSQGQLAGLIQVGEEFLGRLVSLVSGLGHHLQANRFEFRGDVLPHPRLPSDTDRELEGTRRRPRAWCSRWYRIGPKHSCPPRA